MDFPVRVALETILEKLGSKKRSNVGDDFAAARNAVMSPASLDIALRMVACGAQGPTLDQLLSFFEAPDVEYLNSKAAATMSALRPPGPMKTKSGRPCLKSKPAAIVSHANAVWVDQKYSLSESFKKVVTDVYEADTNSANFRSTPGKAIKEINSWAEKTTNGCIKNLVNSQNIDRETVLVLANAVYFKGRFPRHLFYTSRTSDDTFHLLNGTDEVTVPFMNNSRLDLRFASFDDFKVLELPYVASNSRGDKNNAAQFSMYIFLPRERNGLPEMLRKHFGGSNPGQAISQTLGGLKKQLLGRVHIPKWKFSQRCHLEETMKKLGLRLPFELSQDFAKMFDDDETEKPPVQVSHVIQSASIEVNEKGTVAAAATAVILRKQIACAPPRERRMPVDDFIADHPFMFLIKKHRTKALIFVGSVVNPLLKC